MVRRLSPVTTSAPSGVQDGLQASPRIGVAGIGLIGALIYVVIVGGTGSGELHPVLRVLNAALAVAVIVLYVLRAPVRADLLDRAVLVAVILFAVAGALSQFPRQSFDAVLAALVYAAGFFIARDLLARWPVRRAFVAVVIGLSVVFTIGAAALWLSLLVEWWTLAGRSVLPPLDVQLSAGPWGHRYDVGLLIALLYPAWWIGRPSVARRVAAVVLGIVGLLLVIVTGSRTTWLAIAVATAVLGIPVLLGLWSRHPRARLPAVLVAITGTGVAFVLGLLTPLLERTLNPASLDWRLAMWGPLTELWLENPVAGIGPGAFPWALQLTSYFDTRSWAPRHPDNAVMQVLPEAGLLGLVALVLVTGSVLWAVFRGRSTAARWVAVVFAVACVGANPTDFTFLVVIGLGWAAYAAPHETKTTEAGPPRRRLATASLMALGVIFVAHAATLGGGFAYESARSAVERGELGDAREALRLARVLDPGMALYHRQLGAVAYLEGDPPRAVAALERAVDLNPSDDLAWRTLALAHEANRDESEAREALDRAVTVQRADVTNLVLAARSASASGRSDEAMELLAEVVQTWPTIVAAPGWEEVLNGSITTEDIVDVAAERWLRGAPTPELVSDQGVWLGMLAGRPDVLDAGTDRIGDELLSRALAAVIACDTEAGAMLGEASPAQRRSHGYWQLRIRASALAGEIDRGAILALQILGGGSYTAALAELTMNPLDENASLSADRWGYRRYPITWPESDVKLPSIHAGASLWMFDPHAAVQAAGLGDRLPQC